MAVHISMSGASFQPERLPIASITPLTLQDYPDRVASVLWFAGCNFRCAYCHNPDLVFTDYQRLPWTKVEEFLQERRGFIDGIVLSGGECTLSPQLPGLAAYLKSLGYLVKVDTNGSNPAMLQHLLQQQLVDYVAMDWKAPPDKLLQICQHKSATGVYECLELLQERNIPFELRCTIHSALLNEDDLQEMFADLNSRGFSGTLYLQNFQPGKVLGPLPQAHTMPDLTKLENKSGFVVKLRNFTTKY